MILSRYNISIQHKGHSYIYNSVSNCLMEVSDTLFAQIERLSGTDFSVNELSFEKEEINCLCKSRIIVENDEDELSFCKSIILPRRFDPTIANITIAPTMDCNFRCFYCFEEHPKEYMSEEVVQSVIHYINNQKQAKHFNFTWFGGEPLMAFPTIRKIWQSIQIPQDATRSVTVITNGYYMTREVVDAMKELEIQTVQITMDGLFESYNAVKQMKTDRNCFQKLMDNVDYFAKIHKDILLSVRVNLDKKTMNEFVKMNDFIHQRYSSNDNIQVYPAFLKKNSQNEKIRRSACFCGPEDVAEFAISSFEATGNVWILYPENHFNECAILSVNSIAIDPSGRVYKCWEIIGDKRYAFGHLDKEGNVIVTEPKILNRYLYGADPFSDNECLQCAYYPICFGGCPHIRIERALNRADRKPCSNYKTYFESYIKAIIDRKENKNIHTQNVVL